MDGIDRAFWIMVALAILGWSMAILGYVGERLGWWNDTGEVLMAIGTLIGVLTSVIVALLGSTKGQVHRVADGVGSSNQKLDVIVQRLDRQTDILERIHDRL